LAVPQEASIDAATQDMIRHAQSLGIDTIFDRAESMRPCNIGIQGTCCKNCGMGPCPNMCYQKASGFVHCGVEIAKDRHSQPDFLAKPDPAGAKTPGGGGKHEIGGGQAHIEGNGGNFRIPGDIDQGGRIVKYIEVRLLQLVKESVDR